MHRSRPAPALLIDAMGTLLALADPVAPLREELQRRFGLTVDEPTARAALGAEIAYYRDHMQDGADAPGLASLRERCARELALALGPAAVRAQRAYPRRFTELLLGCLQFQAHRDAAPALRRVRAAGSRIVVVSNWDISLADALEQTGLAPLLDGVITSAAVGAAKPDPAIFTAALALAHAEPDDAVHVGDSRQADVAGARACGIRAVLLDRSATATAPAGAALISGLDELVWP